MTRIIKISNGIYILTVVIFLLDSFTNFDIKNQTLKNLVYFGLLIETPIILLCNLFIIKEIKQKIIWNIVPIIFQTFIFVINPMKIMFSVGAWQTQEILYENAHLSFKTIEFQMQNKGAFGYNKRIVEVFYLTDFFTLSKEISTAEIDKGLGIEWVKVNKEMNELQIKYP